VLQLFGDEPPAAIPLAPGVLTELDPEVMLITYLPDAALTGLLPEVAARGLRLALLPHPEMRHARIGFGVASRLEDAVADLLAAPPERRVDLLHCNDSPVLDSVVIGDALTLAPGTASGEGLLVRGRRCLGLTRHLGSAQLQPVTLTTQKNKVLETAALGIVAVEHGRSSAITRRLIEDSAANDGMLHALVLAPRSVLEAARFLLASLFLEGTGPARRLPAFVGHVRSQAITISSARPMTYLVDGVPASATEVRLRVDPLALTLVPGRHLATDQAPADGREGFRIQGLPRGEAVRELVGRPLPWMHEAATEDFKDLFLALRENARVPQSYLILMVLSTLLATIGLFANSAPVIIGAMILAPLMAPIISLAMGMLRGDGYLATESIRSLAWGVALALFCAVALTRVTPLHAINTEIAARLSPTLLDLGVAILSGVAGAYAHARAEVTRSLAGVAIAVALVPPLAVSGIGIGWGEWPIFQGAFLLFLTNLAGNVLAAAVAFLALGFSPFGRAKRGLALALLLVGVVSVPLAVGFLRMVDENRVVRLLEGQEVGGVGLRDVQVRSVDPLHLSARLVSPDAIGPEEVDRVKQGIEARLRQPIVLEAIPILVR
jgi:uncharacterized hydrophobic protein (TIGR00271 family)